MLNKRNKVISTAMPRRTETQDLTCCLNNNPVLDRDNVYFSDQGWAYRHYKTEAKENTSGNYWDEILVAGAALDAAGDIDSTADAFGTPGSKTFLTGDGTQAPIIPSGGIDAYIALATGTAFPADGTGIAVIFSAGSEAGSAATGTVDTDASGDVTAINFTDSGSGYQPGDGVTISEDGGAGAATFTVSEIGA